MRLSKATNALFLFAIVACPASMAKESGDCKLKPLFVKESDFGEPNWEWLLNVAFPTWKLPGMAKGCPRLDAIGGDLVSGYAKFPTPQAGKFNPCYYTKAFAGLDPIKGGYPTPIDTHYPYEFAAPFFMQPGDGSTHHCAKDAIDIGACPKLGNDCGMDCASITDEYGIGHIPPFVPLAAVKNAYNSCTHDICKDWFHFETNGCNIKKSVLDELVYEYFGDRDTIIFQPPILIDGKPSSTYYRPEYLGESPACDDGNCRGPHYCSKEVADAGVIWGDFCPYVHTGENAGLYRHPHIALAALELWIANQCMPDQCASEWLSSPNGAGYGTDNKTATSITWSEMDDNADPMAQPSVPYIWPNSGDGVYPGHKILYPAGKIGKSAPGLYITEIVDLSGINSKMGFEECMEKSENKKDKNKCKNEKKGCKNKCRKMKRYKKKKKCMQKCE